MISRLRGVVREIRDTQLLLEVNGIGYEVLTAPSVLSRVEARVADNPEIELVTFHYQQLEVGRGIPVLIGFLNEVEREFFIRFISVSGVGPRAALKALTQPIPVIARAIDEGDLGLLRSLPGIGEQRAKEIVAKLQGKVGKFALIQTKGAAAQRVEPPPTAVEEEAVAILVQLEYKRPEARQMVKAAIERNPKVKSVEELLNEVYRQQRVATEPGTPHPGAGCRVGDGGPEAPRGRRRSLKPTEAA
ncbi:MAG: Holliday junction DNA helicase RuvA [Candidatus Omnitrophica bacterium]|nr:Holliday junction DNA helicase RuvA [Candidatus Omnitrophota bacterium]